MYHAFAAPLLRSRREFEAARQNAELAFSLHSHLPPSFGALMEQEVIVDLLATGESEKVANCLKSMKERSQPPADLVALVERARTAPERTYTFDSPNIRHAIGMALQ